MILSWLCYGIINDGYKYWISGFADFPLIPNAYTSYRVCPVTIIFIIIDLLLLVGLKKNYPIIMLIWLVIGGINRVVRIQGQFCPERQKTLQCNEFSSRGYKIGKIFA